MYSSIDRKVTATPVSSGVFGSDVAWADETPGSPEFPGLQRHEDRLGFRSAFRPPKEFGISSKRIKEASPFDIAEDADCRGCRAWIRDAGRAHGNRAGSQGQLQVLSRPPSLRVLVTIAERGFRDPG